MSNNRKLQADLDRTLKKVEEGIETFNDIWDKVYSATNQAQKEKFELDLKKEIKKLQRLRDQLKSWLSGNDFKDKSKIIEFKKKIERKMEEFKVCERETKTKAYSREGLAKASKLDPEEQKRMETRTWVQDAMQELRHQIESAEATIEELENSDEGDNGEMREFEQHVNNHNWHIDKLEMVTRALDNHDVDPERIDDLKDSIDYYVECGTEPDFINDEYLYEDLSLEKKLAEKAAIVDIAATKEKKKNKDKSSTGTGKSVKKDKKVKDKEAAAREKKEKKTAHERLIAQQKERKRLLEEEEKKKEQRAREEQLKLAEQANAPKTFSQIAKTESGHVELSPPLQAHESDISEPSSPRHVSPMLAERSYTEAATTNMDSTQFPIDDTVSQEAKVAPRAAPAMQTSKPVSPGPFSNAVPPSDSIDKNAQLGLLQASFLHMPTAIDADELWEYSPENPVNVPASFPQAPLGRFDDPAAFEKLDLETLFFIFYHKQGTYQQFLAAKELKRKSWRFHTKYLTWFLRHQEPTIAKEDYEVGSYVYFDFETSWGQRIKENFTFEYKYLEDEMKV